MDFNANSTRNSMVPMINTGNKSTNNLANSDINVFNFGGEHSPMRTPQGTTNFGHNLSSDMIS